MCFRLGVDTDRLRETIGTCQRNYMLDNHGLDGVSLSERILDRTKRRTQAYHQEK